MSPRPPLDDETYALAQELFRLVRAGDAARVTRLLEMGLVANLRDGKGDSLLMLASYHGHPDLVRALLSHGGDPELANDRGQTPLMAAAFKGDVVIARLLLEQGAAVDARDPGGKTALMLAAMFDRVDVLDLLLAYGADPQLAADDGSTALSAARRLGAARTGTRLAGAAAADAPRAPAGMPLRRPAPKQGRAS